MVAVISACSIEQEAQTQESEVTLTSNQEMARRLDELASIYRTSNNPFTGSSAVEELEEGLESQSGLQRIESQFQLGAALLRSGRSEEAAEQWSAVIQQMTQSGADPNKVLIVKEHLALAYLRLGEQSNCIEHHTASSCIVPIMPEGIHMEPKGSRNAIALYEEVLQSPLATLTHRYLLNVAYMTLGEYPAKVPQKYLLEPDVFASDTDLAEFKDIAGAVGLDVQGLCGGTVIEDLNNDGWLDVVVSSWGLKDPIRVYFNDGTGSFNDVTDRSIMTVTQTSWCYAAHGEGPWV
jgi:hypothetical protein